MVQKAMGTAISCLYNSTSVTVGRLRSISELKSDSEAVDVTTLDSPGGYRVYAQGLRDAGEVTLEGYFDSTQAGQTLLRTLYASGAAVPFTVTFPDETAFTFSAFVRSFSIGAAEVDQVVGFTTVLRLIGGISQVEEDDGE